MNINDHKLLRKLLDDLGRKYAYDRIDYWSMQLDSGMVAEVRFVEPATLPEIVNAKLEIIRCACGVGVVDCASWCIEDGECPKESDGRCCDVCAHYNGGRLTPPCEDCSMLSHWQESELTDDEADALMDDDIMPCDCSNCKNIACDVYEEPCNECTDEKYDVYINWEPRD